MQNQLQSRLYYLDALRAFALILGILFHASLSYMPIFIGWAVMDINTSETLPVFVLVSHSFRMALFFMIAGYFSRMTLQNKGLKVFAQSRLVRIAIPLLVGWFILRPLLVSGWVMGAESMRADVNIINGLHAGLASLSELPTGFLVGTHLWFLYYLILISFSVILLRSVVSLHIKTKNRLAKAMDAVVGWICCSSWSILVVAVPTAVALGFMQHWGLDTPDKSLVPVIPVFLIYSGFFIFGWLMQRKNAFIESFARLSWVRLMLCMGSITATIMLSGFESQYSHPQFTLIKSGYMLSYAVMMWSLISLCLGISKKLFSRPRNAVRYIADASYWLYLVHLPLVIWLQIAFAELPLHWLLKLSLIFIFTLGISLLIYELFVRKSFIGKILNGSLQHKRLKLSL